MALPLRARRSISALFTALLALGLLACNAGPEPVTPEPPPATAAPVVVPTQVSAPSSSVTAPAIASAAPTAPVAPAPTSYRVCHCCCGGTEPLQRCLYRSKGESLDKIIAEDKKPKPECPPNAGCTKPIEYRYCD